MTSGERIGNGSGGGTSGHKDGSFHSHTAPPLRPFQVLMHPGEWGKLDEIEIRGIAGLQGRKIHSHKIQVVMHPSTEEVGVYEECMMVHNMIGRRGHRSNEGHTRGI